jgi:CubicO group peptidase (beta-lactamase class C family)
VLKDGKIVQEGAYGLANVETGTPATLETVYKAASLSKAFLAAATLMLVHDNKLQLDTKACKFLERCPDAWKEITIYQLLTHTAGLVRDPDDYQPYLDRPISAVIESAYSLPLHSAPGTQWLYSNLGYFALAEIITKASSVAWSDFIAQRILRPAGMTATQLNSTANIIPHRATGYTWGTNQLSNAENWIANRPSAAFVTNVHDLAKWDTFLDQQLEENSSNWDQLWNVAHLADGSQTRYAFGWYVDHYFGEERIHHDAMYPGFRSEMERFPEDRLSVIVLANGEAFPSERAAVTIAGLVDAKLKSPTFKIHLMSPHRQIPRGKAVLLNVDVIDEDRAVTDTVIEIEIWDAHGKGVYHNVVSPRDFKLGQRRTEAFAWTPGEAGEFALKAGIYGSGWVPIFLWEPNVGILHVSDK